MNTDIARKQTWLLRVPTVSPDETWITVGEGMYKPEEAVKHGANGRVWATKIIWSRPNTLRLP